MTIDPTRAEWLEALKRANAARRVSVAPTHAIVEAALGPCPPGATRQSVSRRGVIPAVAVAVAGEALRRHMVGDDLAIDGAVEDAMVAVLTAAIPHLVTDEMVERAAEALWDRRYPNRVLWAEVVENDLLADSQREVRAEARAALEAALGSAA